MSDSFEGVDYRVRPNKTVERKLFFEALSTVQNTLGLSEYRYVGLGAMTFVDFVMAHKYLRIADMLSIEYAHNAARASFNAPFKCITVLPGETSVLFNNGTVKCGEKKSIFWLDYDGTIDASVISDLRVICTDAQPGSFLFVTVNAVRASYLIPNDTGNLTLEESLRGTLGALVPAILPANLDTMNGFPPALASILFDHCTRSVASGSAGELRFLPLVNFVYQDGKAPMITIGGAICDTLSRQIIEQSEMLRLPYVRGREQLRINLPVLTPRERRTLDRLLPSTVLPAEAQVRQALTFDLQQSSWEGYFNFYRFYPNFSEVVD